MSVTELEARRDELQREAARKDAQIRVLLARQGGADSAAAQDADLAEQLAALKVTEPLEGDVPLELVTQFFKDAIKELSDPALVEGLLEKVAHLPSDSVTEQDRTNIARTELNELFTRIWMGFNVDPEAASKAVNNAGFLAGSDDLTKEQQADLTQLLDDFQDAEQCVVGPCVLGAEEFAKRKVQRDRFMAIREETLEKLRSFQEDTDALEAFLNEAQDEAKRVQAKLQGMNEEESMAFVENPPAEDEKAMMRMQVLQMILQGGAGEGGHGHSHGGEPCGGHGH
eukprot:CAMPEP_0184524752 /NCGR_PEP_ID=MMETSP0198_2-20121128/9706_1 /TAXON_ID=1112570 /ORGANISM="Thraustochytrium sp., Strain LLF1b" /LENGTH=283 /DNA_ID=CAMNT_0026916113 /DNA_START=88 /DNA_END=939 /DNA_ORIENTATION=+